jgi:predicted Rossmann fold flavoprotein
MESQRIIIVGAGAAGLLAAGRAASLLREQSLPVEVVVLERMRQPGRKIRISGKGRCNLTNTLPVREFIERFGRTGRFLHQAFDRFFTPDLLDLLHEIGIPTVEERGGRIYPASGSAPEVAEKLAAWAGRSGARFETGVRVRGIDHDGTGVIGLHFDRFSKHGKTGSGGARGSEQLDARAILLGTGGRSYPATGSTGDGYAIARELGHEVVATRPALVPLQAEGAPPPGVRKVHLRNVEVRLRIDGRVRDRRFGEMDLTETGLDGPVILKISREAVAALDRRRSVEVELDLKPALDEAKLDARLIRDLEDRRVATWADLLAGLLPRTLVAPISTQLGVPDGKPAHQVTGAERRRLCDLLKCWRFPVTGRGGYDEAIVTAGGVSTREVDPRSMESRRLAGLYIMGELLDVDGDTGGFNLMAAFSTGWVAGEAAARKLLATRDD